MAFFGNIETVLLILRHYTMTEDDLEYLVIYMKPHTMLRLMISHNIIKLHYSDFLRYVNTLIADLPDEIVDLLRSCVEPCTIPQI